MHFLRSNYMLSQRIQEVAESITQANLEIEPLLDNAIAYLKKFEAYKKDIDDCGDKIITSQMQGTLTTLTCEEELNRETNDVLALLDEGVLLQTTANGLIETIKKSEKKMKDITNSFQKREEQIEGEEDLGNQEVVEDRLLEAANRSINFGVEQLDNIEGTEKHIVRVLASIKRIDADYKEAIGSLKLKLTSSHDKLKEPLKSKPSNNKYSPASTSGAPSAPPADTAPPSAPPLSALATKALATKASPLAANGVFAVRRSQYV